MNARACRLFVGSLPWSVTSEQLRELFERVGEVKDSVVMMDKQDGRSKGYGFVEMATEELAKQAVQKFNGYDLNGRTLVVNQATPKAPKTLFMN